jgi:S-adenosylmethionine synthetase
VSLSDGEIAQRVASLFDLRPRAIEERLKLRHPIYEETASYGHMGRHPQVVKKHFVGLNGENVECEVELFTWEKLDYVDRIRKEFF